jgi:hypothetical protein
METTSGDLTSTASFLPEELETQSSRVKTISDLAISPLKAIELAYSTENSSFGPFKILIGEETFFKVKNNINKSSIASLQKVLIELSHGRFNGRLSKRLNEEDSFEVVPIFEAEVEKKLRVIYEIALEARLDEEQNKTSDHQGRLLIVHTSFTSQSYVAVLKVWSITDGELDKSFWSALSKLSKSKVPVYVKRYVYKIHVWSQSSGYIQIQSEGKIKNVTDILSSELGRTALLH